MLTQGKLRDVAVNFGTCQILQWHHAVSLQLHDFLVYICSVTIQMLKYTQYIDFHGRDTKPKITAHNQNQKSCKSHGDHEYVIILQH